MAIEQLGSAAEIEADRWPIIATLGMALYFYAAIVGVLPFADRRLAIFTDAADGNVVKQLLMLGAVAAVIAGSPSALFRLPTAVPLIIVALFGWCAVTLIWSPVPDIGLRRLILTALSVIVVFVYAQSYGAERLWRFLTSFLVVLVVGSLVAGVLVRSAIHQGDDPELGLAGDWRGLLFHKNDTGFIAAVAAIIFLWRTLEGFRLREMAGLFASVLLLVLSGAKTSMIALPIAIVAAPALGFVARRLIGRFWLFALLAIGALVAVTMIGAEWQVIEKLLDNPKGLTGRTAIWSTLLQLARTGAWLVGTGYASLFGVGDATPLAPYLDGWLVTAGHGHNGYFELLLTVGVPGLALAVLGFLIQPLWVLLGSSRLPTTTQQVALTTLVFVALHNLAESSLMDRGHPAFLVLAVVAATAAFVNASPDRTAENDR